jgi:hypothetical protein
MNIESIKRKSLLKLALSAWVFLLSAPMSLSAYAQDQCNTTAQCKAQYGNSATDCLGSQSSTSVCMCGTNRCDANPGGGGGGGGTGGMLGSFNKSKDLLLLFYDNKPDADDIHSQAAAGTLLRDSRFSGINYWGVLGTYGKQNAAFLNSTTVMNACLGGGKWVNAHPKDGSAWNNALNATLSRVQSTLNGGGTVWIAEAGQSDFTADLVRKLKSSGSNVNTKDRIKVIQHSQWNEDQTTSADLSYVKANTGYRKIADGNVVGNGTPGFKTSSGSLWSKATSLSGGAGACWSEARTVANANNRSGGGYHENSAIEAGGMDFSDTVEITFITGFNSLKDATAFFNTFPR